MGMLVSRIARLTRCGNTTLLGGICTNCATQPSASGPPMSIRKSISSALVGIPPYVAWSATSPITVKQPNAKRAPGNVVRGRKGPSCHESTRPPIGSGSATPTERELYTPTLDERLLAQQHTTNKPALVAFLVLLKTFQYLR